MKDQINACLQHYFGCQERDDMTQEQLDYLQDMIVAAEKVLLEIFKEQK
jgi:hypothetical protein